MTWNPAQSDDSEVAFAEAIPLEMMRAYLELLARQTWDWFL
jgi:hypothetical protein